MPAVARKHAARLGNVDAGNVGPSRFTPSQQPSGVSRSGNVGAWPDMRITVPPDPAALLPVHAGARRDEGVVRRTVGCREPAPVTGDRAGDQPFVVLPQRVVIDAEPVRRARAEALDEHVGTCDETEEHVAVLARS